MAGSIRTNFFATAAIAVSWTGTAWAQGIVGSAELQDISAKVELIDNSRLGCGERTPLWSVSTGGSQCAFDTATRGMRLSAQHDFERGSIEAYATVARATSGAFTPDRLLVDPQYRENETTSFALAGIKGSLLDDRLKLTAEFSRTGRVVDELLVRDWALADRLTRGGSSALLRADATLLSRPGLKWSVTGEYRSASTNFSVGRSFDLMRHAVLPGTRLALSTKASVGPVGLKAGIEQVQSPFGSSAVRKAGVDFQGIALNVRSRESSAAPIEGSTLLNNRTRNRMIALDVDSVALAAWLLPNIDELPWLVPTNVSVSLASGETENRYQASAERYARSSLGFDGIWESPIGETSLSYWRDTRNWLSDDARYRLSESIYADHSIRFGNWRFGLDVSLSRTRSDGSDDYTDRSLSFGQSIAYSAKDGPELRISLGQDRGRMQTGSQSYVLDDRYSSITASLDLSKYLQKRFERDDLRMTVDYRKSVDRSESEFSYYEELMDRWIDSDRREGFLMSFGMEL